MASTEFAPSLDRTAFLQTLDLFRELGLLTPDEIDEVLGLLEPVLRDFVANATVAPELRGRIAADVDANGLEVGDARCKTHLVAFASGEAPSPIEDVSVEHAFAFELGAVASLEVGAKLTLKAACGFDAESGKPKTSTETKIKLEFGWSSAPGRAT